jgi:signal transduction histidine kinase
MRIAHDANSWLTSQTFRITALEGDPDLPEPARGHVASLRDSTDALAALVAGARALLVDESEGGPPTRVDLPAWLEAFVGGWRDATGRAGVTIRVPADLPPVRASDDQLGRVFEALLANASDAMGRDAAAVEVREAPGSGDAVTVDVVDDGGPWDVADAERLAEPLVTGAPGSVRAGLGLYRARRAMERMGGTLAVVERADAPGAYAVRLTFPAG